MSDEVTPLRRRNEPITLHGQNGETYTITPTERGLKIEIGEDHRLVYTSLITDSTRMLRFEVEPVRRKKY